MASKQTFPEISVRLQAGYWAVYEADAPDESPLALFTSFDDALNYQRKERCGPSRISPLWLGSASLFRPEWKAGS